MAKDIIEINERSLILLRDNENNMISSLYEKIMTGMLKYLNFVMSEQSEISKIRLEKENYDTGWYQSEIQKLDSTRRALHNDVMFNLNIANKFCMKSGIPLVYDGDLDNDHREQVFDSIRYFFYGDERNNMADNMSSYLD